MRYVIDHVDDPSFDQEILPFGDCWHLLNSSFVNGFLDWGKPVAAWVLERDWAPDAINDHLYPHTLEDCGNLVVNTREHAISLTNLSAIPNIKLRSLFINDDILLLIQNEHDLNVFMLIWVDGENDDDHSILRFRTRDPIDDVINECPKIVNDSYLPTRIGIKFLNKSFSC